MMRSTIARTLGFAAVTTVLVILPLAAATGAAATAASGSTDPQTTLCQAVAHHEDAAHNGYSCATLPAAPVKKWSTTVVGTSSYPLIAGGKVFVVAVPSSGAAELYALNETTGKSAWGPVPLSGSYYWFAIAYGDGKVFVNDFDGTVTAYSASSGRQMWAQTTNYFSGEPVAANGVLYLQGSGPVYALNEQTGAILWTSGGLDGDGSSVSVTGNGVYVAAGCSRFRLSLVNGSVLWGANTGCTGGGGGTTYLSQGRDFETVGDLVLNASTGATVGTFSGTPAFSGDDAFLVSGTSVFCENVHSLTPVFSSTLPSAATTSPIIAGQVLYVGAANSKVYGVSTTTGKIVMTRTLPGVPGGGQQYSDPISDIGIGDNLLVVPTGDIVTAFG